MNTSRKVTRVVAGLVAAAAVALSMTAAPAANAAPIHVHSQDTGWGP
jgi:Spy/CpxP family protein refolding chaperone